MNGNVRPVTVISAVHTANHINCPACLRAKKRTMDQSALAELGFEEAAVAWLEVHQRYIAPRTRKDYLDYIKALTPFFGGMQLPQIHIGNVREYQVSRKISAGRVNQEISCLQQILREAKLWEPIGTFYQALPVSKKGSGRALNPAEEERLLAVAFSRNRWQLAAHCLRIMLRTGTGFGELRGLRRGDVDLARRIMHISEGAKNDERDRPVPLNASALESMEWLVKRWERIGGRSAHEYLLPMNGDKRNILPDFSKPCWGIKKAWTDIRKKWAGDDEWLKKFRIYDCRVTAVTKSLQSGKVSIHTAKKLYGHVSESMQKRYYKPDMETLREAVNLLEPNGAPVQRPSAMPESSRDLLPDEHQLRKSVKGSAGGDAGALVRNSRAASA